MKSNRETIFVTGGSRIYSSHLCELLLKMNKQVICLDNFDDSERTNVVKIIIKLYNL